jgi:uncharacterized YigZ family protein
MQDSPLFYSIGSRVTCRLKIKRSEFICSLAPVKNLEQAKAFIARVSKEHKTATHNCWAYVVGETGQLFHSSDAGEPAGTAGKPMLNALQHHRLTDIAAVVTRHYGGVKLGVKGLMDAYFAAVDQAVSKARLHRRMCTVRVHIRVGYDYNEILLGRLKTYGALIRDTSYAQQISHFIDIDKTEWDTVLGLLEQQQAMNRLEFTVAKEDQ